MGATWPLPLSEISRLLADVLLRQPDLAGLVAIDVDVDLGLIDHLVDMDVGGAGNAGDLGCEICSAIW